MPARDARTFFSLRIDGQTDRAGDLRAAGAPLLTLLRRAIGLGDAANPALRAAVDEASGALNLQRTPTRLAFSASFWDTADGEGLELALAGPGGALRVSLADRSDASPVQVDGHLDAIEIRWAPSREGRAADVRLLRGKAGWTARLAEPGGSADYRVIAGEVEALARWTETELYRPRTGDRFRALLAAAPTPPKPRAQVPVGTSFPTDPPAGRGAP